MKLTVKLICVFAMAAVLMTYSGCGSKKKDPIPPTDTQIDKLSKTWKVSSVTLDGTAKDYTAFTLKFAGTHGQTTINYTASSRPTLSPWPASGTITFSTTNPTTNFVRNDSATDTIPVTYSVSDTQLVLVFTYNGDGFSNRVSEVKGAWVFTMVPQ